MHGSFGRLFQITGKKLGPLLSIVSVSRYHFSIDSQIQQLQFSPDSHLYRKKRYSDYTEELCYNFQWGFSFINVIDC